MPSKFRGSVAVAGTLATIICTGASASAAVTTPSYTCRSSAAIVNLGGTTAVEPLVANANRAAACRTDGVGVPLNLQDVLGAGTVSATAPTAFAQTVLSSSGGATNTQSVATQAGVENLDLNLSGGALHVQAQGVIASAGTTCTGTTPGFPTFSKVVGLTINGQAVVGGTDATIPLDSGLGSLSDQLAGTPLASLVKVQTEKVSTTGTPGGDDEGRVVEALHIDLLSATGTPVASVIVGRAEAGRHGAVCAASTTPGTPGTPGTNTNTNTTTTTTGGSGTDSATSGSSTGSGTSTSSTSSGSKAIPNGTNGSTCARVTAFFDTPGGGIATSGPRSIRSRFGVRNVIRGKVVNCKGKSIARARLEVVHYLNGTMRRQKTGLRTRAGGGFTLILPLNIKTRSIVISYRGSINRAKVAGKKTLKVTVYDRRGSVLR